MLYFFSNWYSDGNLVNSCTFVCFIVGDLTQSMIKSKMDAVNLRLKKLGEKYEKIKQLEEQMKESNQILDLLLERR